MTRKPTEHSIARRRGPDPGEQDLATGSCSKAEFEQRLQGLPESARLLLRFARERGLLPSEVNGETKRVPASRDR